MYIDLSVRINLSVESQKYQLEIFVIDANDTGEIETYISQALSEACKKIAHLKPKETQGD